MKLFFFLMVGVLVSGGTYYFYVFNSNSNESPSASVEPYQVQEAVSHVPALNDKVEEGNPVPGQKLMEDLVSELTEVAQVPAVVESGANTLDSKPYADADPVVKDLFMESNEDVELIPTNEDFSRHGRPIRLDISYLRTLKTGHRVNLPLATGHTLLVESIEHREGGKAKIQFSLSEQSKIYRAFLTIGETLTVGRIITPEGGFELEVVDGKGWIVDTRYIDDRMPENGVDYLLPKS